MNRILLILLIIITTSIYSQDSLSQEPQFKWQHGPMTAALGLNIAEITIDSNYLFLEEDDTRKIMSMIGNLPSNQEMGLITTVNKPMEWFLLFENKSVGYVPDDDKEDIDADAILENIKEGTEAANEQRKEIGGSSLHVLGWYEEPRYDEKTNNLVWAITAESDGDTIVNYNTRILGRSGYTSVVLVSSVNKLNAIKPEVETLLNNFKKLTYKFKKSKFCSSSSCSTSNKCC